MLKDGVHIEASPRRVRTYFGGKLIADSDHVLLVYETKRPPAYWFPITDVRMEYLDRKGRSDPSADAIRWRLAVNDRVVENAARPYGTQAGDRAPLENHLTFHWDQVDTWFEDVEGRFALARNPSTRADRVPRPPQRTCHPT